MCRRGGFIKVAAIQAEMKKQVNANIFGEVQGRGYRYGTSQEALRRGLVGFVRNAPDGSVELVAEGEEQDLKDFIDWCYTGVGSAMVRRIDIRWSEATSEFSDFLIRY